MELDRAVARAVETSQQVVTEPHGERCYTPDELEVVESESADLERWRLVRGNLHEMGAELAAAVSASDHEDWGVTLRAIRMIHGRVVVTRQSLEGMLTSPVAADGPPIVRAVQAVGRIISEREVDSLPPDELRARMRVVLQTLDRELKALLAPPDEPPISADGDDRAQERLR